MLISWADSMVKQCGVENFCQQYCFLRVIPLKLFMKHFWALVNHLTFFGCLLKWSWMFKFCLLPSIYNMLVVTHFMEIFLMQGQKYWHSRSDKVGLKNFHLKIFYFFIPLPLYFPVNCKNLGDRIEKASTYNCLMCKSQQIQLFLFLLWDKSIPEKHFQIYFPSLNSETIWVNYHLCNIFSRL